MARREPKGAMEIAARQLEISEEILFGKKEEKKMVNVKEVKVISGSDVAVVRLTEEGAVEIIREGVASPLKGISFEDTVKKFETNGWTVENNKMEATAAMNNIPVTTQKEVDEYLELHAAKAELEAKMDKLKKNVRNYMDNNGIKEVTGTNGRKIYLQDAAASNSTATFSNYELAPVMATLNNNEILREVTEIRVNSDKLEALLKLNKLPKEKVEEIKALKIVKQGTPRFTVKK